MKGKKTNPQKKTTHSSPIKSNLKKKEFYTDVNIINLPIFTSSKNIIATNEPTEIILKKHGVTTQLNISYPGKKLTFFDRKILATIEYIYSHKFDFNKIQTRLNTEIENQKEKFLKKLKKSEEKLSEASKQQIIVEAMEIVKREFKLYLTLKDISMILFKNNYLHTEIRESLLKLRETKILQASSYTVDGSKLQTSTTLINMTISREGNTDNIIVSLGTFHFFNILQKNKTYKSDLILLNSFDSQIAGRLSELIKKSLYGSKRFLKNKTVFSYSYLCKYLQVKQRSSPSLIKQQLQKPFTELISKKIISNYLLQKDLFEYTISFYYSYDFYKEYWEILDPKTKTDVNRGLVLLAASPKFHEFEQAIESFMESTEITDEEQYKKVESYYRKYHFINNYKISDFDI